MEKINRKNNLRMIKIGTEYPSIDAFISEWGFCTKFCQKLPVSKLTEILSASPLAEKNIGGVVEAKVDFDPHRYLFWFEKTGNSVVIAAIERLRQVSPESLPGSF